MPNKVSKAKMKMNKGKNTPTNIGDVVAPFFW
jgi:hypothetical protein